MGKDSPAEEPQPDNEKAKDLKGRKSKNFLSKIFRRKLDRSLPTIDAPPSSAVQSNSNSTTSESTVEATSSLSHYLLDRDPQVAANCQRFAEENQQTAATFSVKARWAFKRKSFLTHLIDIDISLEQIITIVDLRIPRAAEMASEFRGLIPDEILSVQDSLQRLHSALVEINKDEGKRVNQKPLLVSIRSFTAKDCEQMKKKIQADHDYLRFRENSIVYPLQAGFPEEKLRILILAAINSRSSTSPLKTMMRDVTDPLSQLLCEINEEAENSFQMIHSSANLELYQDISTSWKIQDNLESIMKRTTKFRTYISLAVQIATSYMHFVPIAQLSTYPGLSSYQYYSPDPEESKDIGHGQVLMHFLDVGLGSKAPKKTTHEIGGYGGQTTDMDIALVRLGLLLHQVACWYVFDDMDLETARDNARARRSDLIKEAGTSFTKVVDSCLNSKNEDIDSLAQSRKIYGYVVMPLQDLVDELKWDR